MMTKHSPGFSPRTSWLWPVAALSLLGCPDEELAPIGPCTVSGVFDKITQGANDEVDLLFVVDNSKSMELEQALLAEQLPRLVTILASGKILDDAGMVVREFPAVKRLHLGVVSTNMGISGTQGPENCSDFGDDGVLLNTPAAGCTPSKPLDKKYLEFTAGVDDAMALGTDFGCITNLGTSGCGFEQQLEAGLKALAPKSNATFSRQTRGHGDGANAGFLRPESVVAVIHVSDEEDCSIPDSARDVFSTTPPANGGLSVANVQCTRNDDRLHKLDRYVKGLKDLRPGTEDQVIFAAIVGIPETAEGLVQDGVTDFDGILKLPAMQYMEMNVPSASAVLLTPSCQGDGDAYPPRRFVEVAKGFGKNGIIKSICRDDFSPALTAIIDKIADQLQGACLERTLIADAQTGLAPCGLVEYQKIGALESACDTKKGRRFLEVRADEEGNERVVCAMNQLAVKKDKPGCEKGEVTPAECLAPNPNPTNAKINPQITKDLVGWYYDDFSADLLKNPLCNSQRIAFTEGAEQAKGTEVRFECLQPVFSVFANPKGVDAVNKPCKDDKEVCSDANDGNYSLFCEDEQRSTCQIECEEDANCPDGWVCDKDAPRALCLNPTCPSN